MITVKTRDLKRLILKAGLTQAAFSKKIGVTQGYVSQLLMGKRSVSAPTAKAITESLGCTFDDVFEVAKERGLEYGERCYLETGC